MKNILIIILAVTLLQVFSCTAASPQRENTKARYEEYKSAVKYYDETEADYIILLENLEKYPKETHLLTRKQILRKEMEQNRVLMLQARLEFEKALQEWDKQVQKMETGLPSDSLDLRQIFGLPSPNDSLRYND
jgi:uncharacterized protein with gpF-like domain